MADEQRIGEKTTILFLCTGNSCRSQMAGIGVDISKQRSNCLSELPADRFDYVVTLCGHAHESCPYFPGRVIHRGFDDPPALAAAAESEEEQLFHYRRVRDEIRDFIHSLPASLEEEEVKSGSPL